MKDQIKGIKERFNNESYDLIREDYQSLGDESSLYTLIYEEYIAEGNGNIITELESILQETLKGGFYKNIIRNGLKMLYNNEFGDTIHIHSADHHIYIMIFESGQY